MRLSDADWQVEGMYNTVQPVVVVTRDPTSGELVAIRLAPGNRDYEALLPTSLSLGFETPSRPEIVCSSRAWYYELIDPCSLSVEEDRRLLALADLRGFQMNQEQPLETLSRVRDNIINGFYDARFIASSSQAELELRWALWLVQEGGW